MRLLDNFLLLINFSLKRGVHKLYPLSPSDVSELAKNAAMRVVNFIEPTKFRMVDESLDSYLRLGCVLMANVK